VTLEWAWWFTNHRLLEPIGYIPPGRVRKAVPFTSGSPGGGRVTQVKRSPVDPGRFTC
jgi:hypothetical protein